MTEDRETQQKAEDTTNAVETCRYGNTVDSRIGAEGARPEFNRYLFENLMSNVECQIEYWNRKADCDDADPTTARVLRIKAEALGYALRLLNAFEPEFRELVDCASRAPTEETIQR